MTIFFPVLTIHGEKHAIVKPLLTEPKDTQFWIDTLKRQVIFCGHGNIQAEVGVKE